MKIPSAIPVRTQPSHRSDSDASIVNSVLTRIAEALAQLIASGTGDVIDLRRLPRMQESTYRSLRDTLSTGEVTAVVDANARVEISETQYPGVWWLTHRGEHGSIVTELIEVAEVPGILKPHAADMRHGLGRLERRLSEPAQNDEPDASPSDAIRHGSGHPRTGRPG